MFSGSYFWQAGQQSEELHLYLEMPTQTGHVEEQLVSALLIDMQALVRRFCHCAICACIMADLLCGCATTS